MIVDLDEIGNNVMVGNIDEVVKLTQQAIEAGLGPSQIINDGLVKGMNVVGKKFKANEVFVPEVMIAARAMKAGMELVRPLIVEGDIPSAGKVVLGTVAGDLHDIGKNLVAMMMESGGLAVVNLGIDISSEEFAAAVQEHKPDVLAMSALLTTTMLAMKDTIGLLEKEGLRGSLKIIVGGAPVTADFAEEIGADGWAPDAASAKDLAIELSERA